MPQSNAPHSVESCAVPELPANHHPDITNRSSGSSAKAHGTSSRPTGDTSFGAFSRISKQRSSEHRSALSAAPETNHRGCARLIDNLSQQKLRAWQPVLTLSYVIFIFVGFGILFLALGIFLLISSDATIECKVKYDGPATACSDAAECTDMLTIDMNAADCVGLNGKTSIKGPVFVYYRLTNYYQNHRRYVKSRSDAQLRGDVIERSSDLSSCDPLITDPADNSKVLLPCGLIAWSVFNDTISLIDSQGDTISMDENPETIAWEYDVGQLKNPPHVNNEKVNDWMNEDIFPGKIQNAHFIVWMRVAALPDFRKLYGRINEAVDLPLSIEIASRYPVAGFKGEKWVVLSQTTWLGGRNSFLGISYIVIGCLCFVFGCFFIVKNYQKPRLLGDVRHLNWIFNKKRKSKHAT